MRRLLHKKNSCKSRTYLMRKTSSTLLQALAIASNLLIFGSSLAAGVAGFHPNCQTCHTASPPSADNANSDACLTCHGEQPEKGQITVNGKTLNPHKGHFDVINCTDCHAPHQSGKNGCADCHKIKNIKMPESSYKYVSNHKRLLLNFHFFDTF